MREVTVTIHRQQRILRKYRNMPPGRFHGFNQNVRKNLADNQTIPESTWGTNTSLLTSYLTTSDKHDTVYHQALYRSVLEIAERDLLQAQLIIYLDEIASLLEAAAVRNPALLLSSGFDLTKERRSGTRAKGAKAASAVSTAEVDGNNP
jgi:hypothetical protein